MMMYHKVSGPTGTGSATTVVKEKEAIHSGHFMVSHFEAEAQDDEDEVAVPVPEDLDDDDASLGQPYASSPSIHLSLNHGGRALASHGGFSGGFGYPGDLIAAGSGGGSIAFTSSAPREPGQTLSIETSLSKLFQCMSLAYRQKLTSPKWNRFKGIRLRWKEKIRLNNVIWRCWHMQFILKQSTLVCQFASPLDVDTHNKPEAVVLEGKYWKRKLAAVTAEYKKWRMYRRSRILGCFSGKDGSDMLNDVDMLDWQPDSNDSSSMMSMMVDQDYMEFMSDTLFSTIQSNQPFAFPDTREIAKGAGLADFIQPSLVQLQPNLDDFMDTLEPLQELFSYRLPPVPEEAVADDALLRSLPATSASYPDLSSKGTMSSSSMLVMSQIEQSSQGMGMYQSMNDPYRQPEYVSVESLSTDTLDNRALQAAFSESNIQVPMQLIQQQQQQQQQSLSLSQLPQQHMQSLRSPNKTRVVRPSSQSKGRLIAQAPQLPVLRKQITHVSSHQSLPMQDQRLHQQQQYRQPQEQQTPSVGYQLYPPSSPVMSHPQPPPLPPSMPESPSRPPGAQIKIQPQSYSTQVNSQIAIPGQQQLQHQTVITPEAFKFSTNITQRSYSLPSPQTASVSYASSGSNLRNISSGSMTNIHCASLSTVDKTPTRSETELFAVPKYQKLRNRSRSGSSLLPGNSGSCASSSSVHTMGTGMGPRGVRPLVSAASNPDLSSAHTSALLAQLLTANSSPVYNFTAGSDSQTGGRIPINKSHNIPILPMPSPTAPQPNQVPHTTALLITSSVPMTIQPSCSTGQLILNSSASTSTSSSGVTAAGKSSDTASDSSAVPSPVGLSLSPLNMENMSPPQPLMSKSDTGIKVSGRGEHRRVCHINAEQKRRCNIKNGFDMLHSLIPQLRQNPNTKTSKAAMLQKGAEYIKQLRSDRNKLKEEMDDLRQQIEKLNSAISNCQSMLPATGAPVSRHRASKMREMFDEYVRVRTLDNWKFWIFSLMVEPLLVSFNSSVSTSSMDELYRTIMHWVEKHCSLVELRPVVLNSLRYLCTSTDILSDPTRLPEEAQQAVLKNDASRSVGGSASGSRSSDQPH